MSNFTVTNLGSFAEIADRTDNDILPPGKVFLKDSPGLTSCEISVNSVPKGMKAPYKHKHRQNEEIFIFVEGTRLMSVDRDEFGVKGGTCVKMEPAGCRCPENTGEGELA